MRSSGPAATLAAALFVTTPSLAAPGDQIGSALVVVNQVTAELLRETRTLQKGDRVRLEEIIQAASDGSTELKLDDETKLAVGRGAKLKLDKFVYAPAANDNTIVLDLAKGAFRFITGVAAKPAYEIRTPSASITVRGTIFDAFVDSSNVSWLLLHEGGVRICNSRKECRIHDIPGRLVRIAQDGTLGDPHCWNDFGSKDRPSFEEMFPFVVSPPTIDDKPVFTRTSLAGSSLCARPEKPRKAENSTRTPVKHAKRLEKPKKLAAPKLTFEPRVELVFIKPPHRRWHDAPVKGEGIKIPRIPRHIKVPNYDFGQSGSGKSGLGLKGISWRNRLR